MTVGSPPMWWHPGAGHACCQLSVGSKSQALKSGLFKLPFTAAIASRFRPHFFFFLKHRNLKHTQTYTNIHTPPLPEVSLAVCRWAFRATALCCVAQVFWLYPSVSYKLAGRAMINIALLWWIYCSNPHAMLTKGCQASSNHDPFRTNTHSVGHRRAWVSHHI